MSVPEWSLPFVRWLVKRSLSLTDLLDVDYLQWFLYLLTPIIIAFILPLVSCLLVYGSALFLHVFKLRNRIKQAYATSIWDGARTSLASFWDAHGSIWHGYEVSGLDYLPATGPALIVYYHGTLPIDIYYLMAKLMLKKNRTLHCVVDKFLFKIPGLGVLCKVIGCAEGTVDSCVDELRQGYLLCVAPGGVREALFSDSKTYPLLWARRLGFAKVALKSKVPVFPMFTENVREAFRTPACGRKFFRWLYEKTRLPLTPIYGGLPVKLRTYLGASLPMDDLIEQLDRRLEEPTVDRNLLSPTDIIENETNQGRLTAAQSRDIITQCSDDDIPEVLAQQVRCRIKTAIEEMIAERQRLPGSMLMAMVDRFKKRHTNNTDTGSVNNRSPHTPPMTEAGRSTECPLLSHVSTCDVTTTDDTAVHDATMTTICDVSAADISADERRNTALTMCDTSVTFTTGNERPTMTV